MATFHLPNTNPPVPVHLTPSIDQKRLLEFPAFKLWLSTLQHSLSLQRNLSHPFYTAPYQLRQINVQSVDYFGERLGFVKLRAEVTNEQGEALPGSVFLRGGSVAMLLILQPDDVDPQSETDKHVILTVQARIPAGSLTFTELPAGMLHDSTFTGGAAKEIEEETGLIVTESELVNLTDLALVQASQAGGEKLQDAMYPSAGGCDEFIPIFLWQKRIPRGQLKEWQGKLTGLREEGEKITIQLIRLEDLWKAGARDAKTLGAYALYHGLKREGRI